MNIKGLVFGLVSMVAVVTAHAASVDMTPEMKALAFQQIGVYTSQPGETLHAFLLRLAPVLRDYTRRTGTEACGAIAKDAAGYGVALGSNESQIGCLAGEAGVPAGMTWTGETIHSHPAGSFFYLTRNDRKLAWATHAEDPGARTFEASPNGFSDTDYASGPGYLVAGGRLLYESRPHQQEVVGVVGTVK